MHVHVALALLALATHVQARRRRSERLGRLALLLEVLATVALFVAPTA